MAPLTASRLLAVLLLAGGTVAVFTPARAQVSGPPGIGGVDGLGRASPPSPRKAPALARPPAIPGSHAASEPVAPARRLPLDMPPTEALFDAINRGDMAAARDAITRGADLNGKNVLGLTPLELSVDLGRNEISFLLLSMRRVGGDRGQEAAAFVPEPAASARKTRGRERLRAAELATTPASAPARLPRNGGTPVPSAGFLGFDFGHQSAR